MSLFLDCEFNGHNGHLISIAIVSDTNQEEFYEVMPGVHHKDTVPWVRENVLPVLGKQPAETEQKVIQRLWNYLIRNGHATIVADSPADFAYLMGLCHYMTGDNKYRYISQELSMRFIISSDYVSKTPHNALSDARALRDWYATQLRLA